MGRASRGSRVRKTLVWTGVACAILMTRIATPANAQRLPQTQPADDLMGDTTDAQRRFFAADPSVVPTLLLWLGGEQDGVRVGASCTRLRLAYMGVMKFRLKEAVPYLASLYDDPTATHPTRIKAAEAAFRVDPYYSRKWLEEVLDNDDSPAGDPESLTAAQRVAAVALASLGDTHAQDVLIAALNRRLFSLNFGVPERGPASCDFETGVEIGRMSSASMLKRVEELRPRFTTNPAAIHLRALIQQMETNLESERQLAQTVAGTQPADRDVRDRSIIALGAKAGPEALPLIHKVLRRAQEHLQAATTQPTAQLWERQTIFCCEDSIRLIESRNPVPQTQPAMRSEIKPLPERFSQDIPDDADLVVTTHVGRQSVAGMEVHVAIFTDPQELLPIVQSVVRDNDLFAAMQHLPYGAFAKMTFSNDRTEVKALRLIPAASGEAAFDGYSYLAIDPNPQGPWHNRAIMLRKLGHQIIAWVPNHVSKDNNIGPDKPMMQAIESFSPGDVVEAGFEPGPGVPILRYLHRYRSPLSARWGKLTTLTVNNAQLPAAQLEIARRPLTCLLPDGSSPDPTLDGQALADLPEGIALKVVADLSENPPRLLAIRPDGGIAKQSDGNLVAVRGGRVKFTARQDQGWRGTFELVRGFDIPPNALERGISQALASNRPLPMPRDQLSHLLDGASATRVIPPPQDSALSDLVQKWLAASEDDRPEVERQLELQVSRVSLDLDHRQAAYQNDMRTQLGAMQVRQLIDRTHLRPFVATTRPATRPAATQP